MAAKRQKLIYFGKRDDAIWDAIQGIPAGDQNYHMKEAFRMYFLAQEVEAIKPKTLIKTAPLVENEDHTKKINLGKLTGSMIL
ncbi:hypothetical protein [Paenibacillus macquariensis]|uniref:Uncharacterized protein n=1 Tax=Paenibacillus macquariensis TaxID=948756 RepID=A0ABY1K788_9BACL|nr:hypothetical protein [Paenibacillus macquariensis]MEC0092522.1 hypothetical protein [Paenibacillus macquariensis]OAB35478.1 hypothetical protein PMSM_09490 [Paenibacillus macquariensis subsp. macquariensis]SIR35122.1 hypothetical protein SAMN05421578_111144 [Paenibacillus macquariensis]